MTRKSFFASRFSILIDLMLLTHLAHSHDAFYPHHREDFEAITRRQELRGTVLLITAGFISVLAGVFYVALRSSKKAEGEVYETEQTRLERAANEAAQAARAVLEGQETTYPRGVGTTFDAALRAALAAYAHASGVAWNQSFVAVSGQSIRCKIGADVVVVRIFDQTDKYKIEVNASCGEAKYNTHGVLCKRY